MSSTQLWGIVHAGYLIGADTTVPVLARGKCRTGRIWTYLRDDRPFGGRAPPAAVFYSPASIPSDILRAMAGFFRPTPVRGSIGSTGGIEGQADDDLADRVRGGAEVRRYLRAGALDQWFFARGTFGCARSSIG